jgi:hypothetical protein
LFWFTDKNWCAVNLKTVPKAALEKKITNDRKGKSERNSDVAFEELFVFIFTFV